MKNFIIAFFVFLVWSFFGLWLYLWLQPSNTSLQSNSGNPITSEKPDISKSSEISSVKTYEDEDSNIENPTKNDAFETNGLRAVTEDGDVLFNFSESFSIQKNSDIVKVPEVAKDFKYKLNSYLIENPNTELHITSIYSPAENIESPNYGMKRGKKVKELLVAVGVPAERIVIKARIMPISFSANNTYDNAISFLFQPLNVARLETAKKEIPESTTIYPQFSTSGVLKSKVLESTLEEIKIALENNPDAQVTIIGHTDNVGNATDNYDRGLEFARQVRWYFINKGRLDRKQIRAISKGESEPVDTNKSERGRNANQRIEIQYSIK